MQVLLIQGLHFLFSLFNIVQLCYIIHGYRLERNYEENYYYEKREFHPGQKFTSASFDRYHMGCRLCRPERQHGLHWRIYI